MNTTVPAAVAGLSVAVSVSAVVASVAGEAGATSNVVVVAVSAACTVVVPTDLGGGAALATPPMSKAVPAMTATRVPDASRVKNLFSRTI